MSSALPRTPVIAVERRLTIPAPLARVFAYAADLRNDAAWRTEIHGTELNAAAPGLGVVATEDAYLSPKRPHSITRLQYVAYEPDRYMRCEAAAGSEAWAAVSRTFRPLGPSATELTYSLEFEQGTVQQALGFAPPRWFLRWYTGWMMTRYLRQLKGRLEAPVAAPRPAAV